jgi:hypothetical protein
MQGVALQIRTRAFMARRLRCSVTGDGASLLSATYLVLAQSAITSAVHFVAVTAWSRLGTDLLRAG